MCDFEEFSINVEINQTHHRGKVNYDKVESDIISISKIVWEKQSTLFNINIFDIWTKLSIPNQPKYMLYKSKKKLLILHRKHKWYIVCFYTHSNGCIDFFKTQYLAIALFSYVEIYISLTIWKFQPIVRKNLSTYANNWKWKKIFVWINTINKYHLKGGFKWSNIWKDIQIRGVLRFMFCAGNLVILTILYCSILTILYSYDR